MPTTTLTDSTGRSIRISLPTHADATAVLSTSWGTWRGMPCRRAYRFIARLRRGEWR